MQIVVYGWNGMHNFGDDCMTSALLSKLTVCGINEKKIFIWGGVGAHRRNLGTAPHLYNYIFSFVNLLPLIRRLFYRYVSGLFLPSKVVLVFGGGKILNDKNAILTAKGVFRYVRRSNGIIIGYGLSLDSPDKYTPYENDYLVTLSKINTICARDKSSYDVSVRINKSSLNYTDPAISRINKIYSSLHLTRSDHHIMGVSLRHGQVTHAIEINLVDFIEKYKLIHPNLRIRFISLSSLYSEDDSNTADLLLDAMPDHLRSICEVIRYSDSEIGTVKLIAECDFIVAQRLHAAIAAYSIGVPFVAIPYDKKVTDFLSTVFRFEADYCFLPDTIKKILDNEMDWIRRYGYERGLGIESMIKRSEEQVNTVAQMVCSYSDIS